MDDEKKTSKEAKGSDTIGAIWQSALGQIDEIRDVIVRGSQAGKAKLDVQLLKRQRDRLLVQIGEAVLAEEKRGALTLPTACEELKARIDDVDQQIEAAETEANKAFKK